MVATGSTPTARSQPLASRWRGFPARLAAIAGAGLAVRVAYVVAAKRHEPPLGDGIYYVLQAQVIADGRWFEAPMSPGSPAADHPPLNALVLSLSARLFPDRLIPMRLTLCLVGAATVVLVGLLGRAMARRGPIDADHVGLASAAIAAVYANLWVNDGVLMAESVTAACVAAAMLATYRLLERPTLGRAATVGALVGVAALARAELALLMALVAVPAVLSARRPARDVGRRLAACLAAAVVVVAPWVAYNLARFERPTFLSTGQGHVVAGANCPSTYEGPGLGFWALDCAFLAPGAPIDVDQSELSAWYQARGEQYRNDHLSRLPVVVAARVARVWSVWRVDQMTSFNVFEGREPWVSNIAVWMYRALVPLAVAGAFIARRRDLRIWPLVMLPVLVTLVAGWYYGLVRFRLPAEISVAVLAGVSLAWAWSRWRPTDRLATTSAVS